MEICSWVFVGLGLVPDVNCTLSLLLEGTCYKYLEILIARSVYIEVENGLVTAIECGNNEVINLRYVLCPITTHSLDSNISPVTISGSF